MSKETCIICLEETHQHNKNTVFSKIWNCECRVFFHVRCIYPWIIRNYTCPICKKKYKEYDVEKEKRILFRKYIDTLEICFFYIVYLCLLVYYVHMLYYYITDYFHKIN